jgi:hypothetical protein
VSRGLTTITYLALFLFGIAQGMLGAFYYAAGPDPLAAIGFDLVILATCLLGAWGTGHAAGAFLPAAGWFIATFVLATGTGAGSVIVTASAAGEVFLFGGAICAVIGAVAGFTIWARRKPGGPQ